MTKVLRCRKCGAPAGNVVVRDLVRGVILIRRVNCEACGADYWARPDNGDEIITESTCTCRACAAPDPVSDEP